MIDWGSLLGAAPIVVLWALWEYARWWRKRQDGLEEKERQDGNF